MVYKFNFLVTVGVTYANLKPTRKKYTRKGREQEREQVETRHDGLIILFSIIENNNNNNNTKIIIIIIILFIIV